MPLSHLHTGAHVPAEAVGDHELQADIMRFLAIVALCLMAVFALVQGLPRTPERAAGDSGADLVLELQALEQRAERLRAEQVRIAALLQGAQKQRETALAAAADAQRRATAARSSLERAEQARDDILGTLAQARQQLRTTEERLRRSSTRLERLEQSLRRENRTLDGVMRRKASEARELEAIERRLAALRQSAEEINRVAEASAPEPPRPAAAAEPDGFSLRFASEQALRRMVSTGQVGFYAHAGRSFRQLRIGADGERFQAAPAPQAYYEMTPQTVPDSFIAALSGQAGPTVVRHSTWGVTLPAGVEARVRSLMAEHRGGALVIRADGSVQLERGPRT